MSIPQIHDVNHPDIQQKEVKAGGGLNEDLTGNDRFSNNIDNIYLVFNVKATDTLLRELICQFDYYTNTQNKKVAFRQSKYMWSLVDLF